jgi:hypothetical protein
MVEPGLVRACLDRLVVTRFRTSRRQGKATVAYGLPAAGRSPDTPSKTSMEAVEGTKAGRGAFLGPRTWHHAAVTAE